jgi:hypothetical protein
MSSELFLPKASVRFGNHPLPSLLSIEGGTAGVSILAPGGTTSGLVIWNPAASGVVTAIHRVLAVPLTSASVVSPIGLEYATELPSGGTALAPVALPLGNSNSPKTKAASGATITAMVYFMTLLGVQGTSGAMQSSIERDLTGLLFLEPGMAINLVSLISQVSDKFAVNVICSEWAL